VVGFERATFTEGLSAGLLLVKHSCWANADVQLVRQLLLTDSACAQLDAVQ
jgi:hypothetical protein